MSTLSTGQQATHASLTIHCSDEAATLALVQSLATGLLNFLQPSSAPTPSSKYLRISLQGDLGAGKTTAVRYLLKQLGYGGKIKSPTYSLCEPHLLEINSQQIPIYHFDFYRMLSPTEWIEAGLQEHFAATGLGLCIVEWPEKAQKTLPEMDATIKIESPKDTQVIKPYERLITICALTPRGQSLLDQVRSSHTTPDENKS